MSPIRTVAHLFRTSRAAETTIPEQAEDWMPLSVRLQYAATTERARPCDERATTPATDLPTRPAPAHEIFVPRGLARA